MAALQLSSVDTGDKAFNAIQAKFLECTTKSGATLANPNSTLIEISQAGTDIDDQSIFVMRMLVEFTSQVLLLARSTTPLELSTAVDLALKKAAKEGLKTMLTKTIVTEVCTSSELKENFVGKELKKRSEICCTFTRLMEDVKDFYETFDPSKSSSVSRPKKNVSVVLKKFSEDYSPEKLAAIRAKILCSHAKKVNGCTKPNCPYLHPVKPSEGQVN